jgi:predicted Zn-dependent protease
LSDAIRKWVPILALSALLAAGFACSDDDDNGGSGGGAESAVCSDVSQVQSSADDLKKLNSSSTVGDAQNAVNNMKTSLDQLEESGQSAVQGEVNTLKSAFSDLQSAIQNFPSNQTLGAAAAAIQATASSVQQAVDKVGDNANCS